MTTATAVPQPAAINPHGVGLYGRAKPRCKHVDPDQADTLGFDDEGRCITRLAETNPGPICRVHTHLYTHLTRSQVNDTLALVGQVMREREAVAV